MPSKDQNHGIVVGNRYELREVIGMGGMGVVYQAFDLLLRREVALKTLRDVSEPSALDLFQKECAVLASLSHPNLIDIFDIGEMRNDSGVLPYFVMPFLKGRTLDKVPRQTNGRMSINQSINIAVQVCRGLQAAHSKGVIHRDLKPTNIFILEDDCLRIIDFGIARIWSSSATRGLKGTLPYMSPEQVQMQPLTPKSDIFSFGIILFQMVVGRRPFDGTTEDEVVQAIVEHRVSAESLLNADVPYNLAEAIQKSLMKDPSDRFGSAQEFGDAIWNTSRAGKRERNRFRRITTPLDPSRSETQVLSEGGSGVPILISTLGPAPVTTQNPLLALSGQTARDTLAGNIERSIRGKQRLPILVAGALLVLSALTMVTISIGSKSTEKVSEMRQKPPIATRPFQLGQRPGLGTGDRQSTATQNELHSPKTPVPSIGSSKGTPHDPSPSNTRRVESQNLQNSEDAITAKPIASHAADGHGTAPSAPPDPQQVPVVTELYAGAERYEVVWEGVLQTGDQLSIMGTTADTGKVRRGRIPKVPGRVSVLTPGLELVTEPTVSNGFSVVVRASVKIESVRLLWTHEQ